VAWLRDSPIFEEWRGEAAFRAYHRGCCPAAAVNHVPRQRRSAREHADEGDSPVPPSTSRSRGSPSR
jgi:hypothetical protein